MPLHNQLQSMGQHLYNLCSGQKRLLFIISLR